MQPQKQLPGPWWDTGVLDPKHHLKLVQNRHSIGRRSGLGEHNLKPIWTPLPDDVTEIERKWARGVARHKTPSRVGPMYLGQESACLHRIYAMTGALLRNFVDAQIRTCDDLVRISFDKELEVDGRVLFVSDLGALDVMNSLQSAAKKQVLQVIADRIRRREPVAVYARSLASLRAAVGDRTYELMLPEFFQVEVS